ncbi:hypothetical protein ABBQ32_011344 [Trebouxia sp. C0010 RCD-2024]
MPPRKQTKKSKLGPGKGVENPSATFMAFADQVNKDHYMAGSALRAQGHAYRGYLQNKQLSEYMNNRLIDSLDTPLDSDDEEELYRVYNIERTIATHNNMHLLEQEFLQHEAEEERLRDPARVNSVMEVIARSARDMGLLDRTSQEAPVNKRRKTGQ